jgi:hypothetical protein
VFELSLNTVGDYMPLGNQNMRARTNDPFAWHLFGLKRGSSKYTFSSSIAVLTSMMVTDQYSVRELPAPSSQARGVNDEKEDQGHAEHSEDIYSSQFL